MMTLYHLCLLVMAGLGMLACFPGGNWRLRSASLFSFAAMIIGMLGTKAGLPIAIALLIAMVPLMMTGPAFSALHRGVSNIAMAAILFSLSLINGIGICGSTALPLITQNGPPGVPLMPGAATFITLTLLGLGAYTAFSLYLAFQAAWSRRLAQLVEIFLMAMATVGMAARWA